MTSLYDIISVLLNTEAFERYFDIIILGNLLLTAKNKKIGEMLVNRYRGIPRSLIPHLEFQEGVLLIDPKWLGEHGTVDHIVYLTRFKHRLHTHFYSIMSFHPWRFDMRHDRLGSVVLAYHLLKNNNYTLLEMIPKKLTPLRDPLLDFIFGIMIVPSDNVLNMSMGQLRRLILVNNPKSPDYSTRLINLTMTDNPKSIEHASLIECLMLTTNHESVIYALTKINDRILAGDAGVFEDYYCYAMRELRNHLVNYIELLGTQSDNIICKKAIAYAEEVMLNIDNYKSPDYRSIYS